MEEVQLQSTDVTGNCCESHVFLRYIRKGASELCTRDMKTHFCADVGVAISRDAVTEPIKSRFENTEKLGPGTSSTRHRIIGLLVRSTGVAKDLLHHERNYNRRSNKLNNLNVRPVGDYRTPCLRVHDLLPIERDPPPMIHTCACFYANSIPPRHTFYSPPRLSGLRRGTTSTSTCNESLTPAPHRVSLPRNARAKVAPSARMAPLSKPPLEPFSEFFVRHFTKHHPSIATHLSSDRAALAAATYLFRFDRRLTPDFVNQSLDAIVRAISESTGKSLPESRRLFSGAAKAASHEYFGTGWDDVTQFVDANTPVLLDLQRHSTKLFTLSKSLHDAPEPAPEVDPVALNALLDMRQPVVVMVYADYCSTCKATLPLYEQAAHTAGDNALFVTINGPRSPQFKLYYNVSSYPTILRFEGRAHITAFKGNPSFDIDSLCSFATGDNPNVETIDGYLSPTDDHGIQSDEEDNPRRWVKVLKRQGIDEIDELNSERNHVLHTHLENSYEECADTSCSVHRIRPHDVSAGDPPPLCMLLGGGMGAGKTTAVSLVKDTPFWKEHGNAVVIVEADAFKLNDPLFHVLRTITPKASRIVHHDSIKAAEDLFLQAVNARRDVVFDGTLSWGEYAKQTIEMLRDTDHYYKRGPGYRRDNNGNVSEVYWLRSERRPKAAPAYRVELIGVTADAEVAVMRGIVRRITDGRGVPIPDQLHSHALFSKNFEEYVDLVDSVYLFDTTLNSNTSGPKLQYAEQLVGIKPGLLFKSPPSDFAESEQGEEFGQFAVRNPQAYERFLRKKLLNTMASSTGDLYNNVVVLTSKREN